MLKQSTRRLTKKRTWPQCKGGKRSVGEGLDGTNQTQNLETLRGNNKGRDFAAIHFAEVVSKCAVHNLKEIKSN